MESSSARSATRTAGALLLIAQRSSRESGSRCCSGRPRDDALLARRGLVGGLGDVVRVVLRLDVAQAAVGVVAEHPARVRGALGEVQEAAGIPPFQPPGTETS